VGCSGQVDGTQGDSPSDDDTQGADTELPALDPDDPAVRAGIAFSCPKEPEPQIEPMRRLSDLQYRNTLRDIAQRFLGMDTVGMKAFMVATSADLAEFPANLHKTVPADLHGSYRRLDLDIQQSHVTSAYAVALSAGKALTVPQSLEQVVGACATNASTTDDDKCLSDFIARFGLLALRRPLTADESKFYRNVYGTDSRANAVAYADVIASLLMAPQFTFQVESGAEAIEGSEAVFRLTPYEVASRLSYQYWDTMPDDALLAAAASGKLEDPDGYTNEVERIFADPRTRQSVHAFFNDWLRLDERPDFFKRKDEPIFKVFAGDNAPSATLRDQVAGEILDMVDWIVFDQGRPVQDLMLDEHVLVRGPELARIYGVQPWDGISEPLLFPEGERPGLLTRSALHGFGNANSRPVMKGVFLRRHLLCDDIPPPPADAMANEPVAIDGKTTRQAVAAITEQSGTICASCHTNLINPLGYATENIDAIGRLRTEQILYDDSGKVLASVPIDTTAIPAVLAEDETVVDGPAGLAKLVAESGKVEACMARQYFRFSFARWDTEGDGCVLERLRREALNGAPAQNLLREIALTSAFRQRYIP
jgi:Protein of unknown function (DUF1592)/Protein of unknown function (DUF1588)/Protein of unknown function (DUF1595)/Protein of unknown function (DUF1585)